MNKKSQLFEYLKTATLVVLFFTTILLLYLCLNQSGSDFKISDLIPGGRTNEIIVNVDDYISPAYVVESRSNGKYSATENTAGINAAVNECVSTLMSSSALTIEQTNLEEFEKVLLEEKSILLKYPCDIPLNEYSFKLNEKNIEGDFKNIVFNSLLFSNHSKECIYLLDSEQNCYKIISGENYYSTDRIEKEFDGKIFAEISAAHIEELNEEIIKQYAKDDAAEIEYNSEEIAESIFGDTFDFVRKITDSMGNETYMYGYGEKRLSIYAKGGMEFKQELINTNTKNFYSDLETALLFVNRAIDFEDSNFKLTKAKLIGNENQNYQFHFNNGSYHIIVEVINSGISYFSLDEI